MLFLTLILVLLNGFFVLSEFAIVKVRRTRLEELSKSGAMNANLALKVTGHLDTYLSATQLGITLSSLGLGWVGEPAVAKILYVVFEDFFLQNNLLLHTVSFVVAFTLITLFHVVLGEIVPKSIAIAKAERCVLIIVRPLYYFWLIFYPVIWLFDRLAAFFLKRFGIEPAKEQESIHSEEELKIIVGESLKGGLIDSIEGEIIKNAVDFSDTIAKEIMTPRKDMICLSADKSYAENIQIVVETHHTRYPYYEGSKDNILGMIHIRDLLKNTLTHEEMDLKNILREMIIVPEGASIAQILLKMNKEQKHTALVIDEYGGTAGLLTMEDIIEEIMGDISDEHDKKVEQDYIVDENTFIFNGMMDLESIEEICGINFDESCEQVTIGGYVFGLLGRLPVVGDVIDDGVCEFRVCEVDGARIKKLKLKKLLQEEGQSE
ncbi:hemolysin family protein [Helicobacter sp. faydin-H20]|uniref:hemolysin family protein n=1 Tax=Helicobacter anatolicus TaxID=2905874 RepID=UPI001E4D9B11|nr:hemolysin family protein [Helicobacter anatolicus]MCE3036298.1 hemolysin family protein [Helicobacter anatolicus]